MPGLAFDFRAALEERHTSPRAAILRHTIERATSSALDAPGAKPRAARVIAHRRRYAGDPLAYFHDILGWRLTPQQESVLDLIERETRVLVPSANNVGKTFLLAGYGVYVMDAVASLPDADSGAEEQGARVLLPGPDHDTVFETLYSEMLAHAARAEFRGHLMPGERSERSVLWRVRPKWHVEVMSPPSRVGQAVAHTASGRHHRNQIALIEEGQGVHESLWKATEGMCSSAGNKILSSFNPTEPIGPAYQRSRSGAYKVTHLDAFDHPNVRERRPAVPDAVDFKVIDGRVRSDCRDRGPYPGTPIEPEMGDFPYALPTRDTSADGHAPRDDGILGAVAGVPRVYRPSGAFTAQVRGNWPLTSESALFDAAAWDRGVERSKSLPLPATPPDRVGFDPAREGNDESLLAPAWGEHVAALLRAYADAEERGPASIEELQRRRRIRSGELRVLPKGDGVDTARRADAAFPRALFVVDDGGVGTSPFDHLTRVLHRDTQRVSFAATPEPPVPGEPWSENMRTQLYVRAAMGVARGLVDPPDDPLLREEIMAHEVVPTTRTAEVYDPKKKRTEKMRVIAVALISKDEVKKRIGRSPDRSDSWVLSLFGSSFVPQPSQITPSISLRTLR